MPETSSLDAVSQAGHILVVDDEPKNRLLLCELLELYGHLVTEAADGEQALQEVSNDAPDVILLDVMMPGLDGLEVCRRLKADPSTAPIPILMITSLTAQEDRHRGIDAGANDFLSKPIDRRDVLLRVRNAIYTKRLFDQLQDSYEELRELEAMRDSLVHMIVHDMRSPLTAMHGYLELLEMMDGDGLSDKGADFLHQVRNSTDTLIEMVSDLLDVNKMESGEMPLSPEECDLAALAREATSKLSSLKGARVLSVHAPEEAEIVKCDPGLILRVIQNLLGNALKFTPDGGSVQAAIRPGEESVRVVVQDTGPGVPPEYHEKIFEKFGQVEMREQKQKHSTGLGLTFCKLAVEAHGGQIGVDSEVDKGSTFWFELPLTANSETDGT